MTRDQMRKIQAKLICNFLKNEEQLPFKIFKLNNYHLLFERDSPIIKQDGNRDLERTT